MNNHFEEIIAAFVVGILFLFVIGIFIMLFVKTNFVINEEGYHTGYVTAVEREGIFVKHYRVYFKTDKESSQEDEYCVVAANKELMEGLKETQLDDKKITIHYNDKFTTGLLNPACGIDEIVSFETVQ